jgi:hypothetical protein
MEKPKVSQKGKHLVLMMELQMEWLGVATAVGLGVGATVGLGVSLRLVEG